MSPPDIERAITELRAEALDLARRLSVESFASERQRQCLDAAVHVHAVANMLGDAERVLAASLVRAASAAPRPGGPGTSA
jgi:hypothetical protein